MRATTLAFGAAALVMSMVGARPDAVAGAPAATPALTLVFQSDRDGDDDIYTVAVAGKPVTRAVPLTQNAVPDATPDVSSDGSTIVFARGLKTGWDLFSISGGGAGQQRLTFTSADEFDPVISPDGGSIAFERGNDIYVMAAKPRAGAINVTRTPGIDGDPAWSPDSTSIVFWTGSQGQSDIATVDVSAPGQIELVTSGPQRDIDPDWSRDDRIVFARYTKSLDLFAVDRSGANLDQLTSDSAEDWGPRWTDDGRILFVRGGHPDRTAELPYRIWIVGAAGERPRAVTAATGRHVDVEPSPAPLGKPARSLFGTARVASGAVIPPCWTGTPGANNKVGTANPDCLRGVGGNDTLAGRGGGDWLYGGSGGDTVSGEDGSDPRVDGGTGVDTLNGNAGNDTLYAEDGTTDAAINGGLGTDNAYIDDGLETATSATSH